MGKVAGIVTVVFVIVLVLVAGIADSTADASQALAAIEAAKAAQTSAAGQAVSSVVGSLTVLALVLALVAALAVLGVVVARGKRQGGGGKWAPGPNAGWRRIDNGEAPPAEERPRLSMDPVQQLIMLQMMSLMRESGQERKRVSSAAQARLTAPGESEEDDDGSQWW